MRLTDQMTIPDSIPFSSIDLGERGRTVYPGIEELAESIVQVGLIQPIVLEAIYDYHDTPTEDDPDCIDQEHTGRYLLRAGGRRYTALASLGVMTLYHGASSTPTRYGFTLVGELPSVRSPLDGLLVEIAENHDRVDIPWQDDLRTIYRAYRLFQQQELLKPDADFSRHGEATLRRQFGAMCKMPWGDLKHGLVVIEHLTADPKAFDDCPNIRSAYTKILKQNASFVAGLAAKASYSKPNLPLTTTPASPVVGQPDPALPELAPVVIPLSSSLHFGNGIDFMKSLPDASIDHIVTDPDYGVSVDLLNANATSAHDGVAQASIDQTLKELNVFLVEAFRVTRGFTVLWYDLDHHEKIQSMARAAGFRVQRWPLTWNKAGSMSNAAPSHNFPKNEEWAMVLRKPSTTLAKVQSSSIYTCPAGDTVKRFGHPFAKPLELWQWIYEAVAIKGQTVLDPFAGKGTAPCTAIRCGLRPVACEINEAHFGDLTINMQAFYREALGVNIAFA